METKITSETRVGWYVENLEKGEVSVESMMETANELFDIGTRDCFDDAHELLLAVEIFTGE